MTTSVLTLYCILDGRGEREGYEGEYRLIFIEFTPIDNITASQYLDAILVLWLCKRISLFLEDTY